MMLMACSLKPDPDDRWSPDTGSVFDPWVEALDDSEEACLEAWVVAVQCFEDAGEDPAVLDSWERACEGLEYDPATIDRYRCIALAYDEADCGVGVGAAGEAAAACSETE